MKSIIHFVFFIILVLSSVLIVPLTAILFALAIMGGSTLLIILLIPATSLFVFVGLAIFLRFVFAKFFTTRIGWVKIIVMGVVAIFVGVIALIYQYKMVQKKAEISQIEYPKKVQALSDSLVVDNVEFISNESSGELTVQVYYHFNKLSYNQTINEGILHYFVVGSFTSIASQEMYLEIDGCRPITFPVVSEYCGDRRIAVESRRQLINAGGYRTELIYAITPQENSLPKCTTGFMFQSLKNRDYYILSERKTVVKMVKAVF
jgi:hypothetical protein